MFVGLFHTKIKVKTFESLTIYLNFYFGSFNVSANVAPLLEQSSEMHCVKFRYDCGCSNIKWNIMQLDFYFIMTRIFSVRCTVFV